MAMLLRDSRRAILITMLLVPSALLATDQVAPGLDAASTRANDALEPRRAIRGVPIIEHDSSDMLIIKFLDHARVRAANGVPFSRAGADLTELLAVLQSNGGTLRPLFDRSEDVISAFERRAADRSGRAQPDFAGALIVETGVGVDRMTLAQELSKSTLVEFVYFAPIMVSPPCVDQSPPTTSYTHLQTYVEADPGVNLIGARALGAALGGGITVADCEYGFHALHEDICNIDIEDGHAFDFTLDPNYFEHGTATLGELASINNAYGCSGLVPQASARFFPEVSVQGGWRRHSAVLNAIMDVSARDVVMLEMQAAFLGDELYGPAELDPILWSVVRSGTDSEVIVVAAAGNGNQNLDSAAYQFYRDYGDSGAIIVGAGTSNSSHDKLDFSTFGDRVNVQAWGEGVVTLGYGDLAELSGDNQQTYTDSFNGTSSATPIVTACAVALQSLAVDIIGRRLSPSEMAELLRLTGIPQGSGGHIGPIPDAGTAGATLSVIQGRWVDLYYPGPVELGTINHPYNTVTEAIAALLPTARHIPVKSSATPNGMVLSDNEPFTIHAIGGAVVIGDAE